MLWLRHCQFESSTIPSCLRQVWETPNIKIKLVTKNVENNPKATERHKTNKNRLKTPTKMNLNHSEASGLLEIRRSEFLQSFGAFWATFRPSLGTFSNYFVRLSLIRTGRNIWIWFSAISGQWFSVEMCVKVRICKDPSTPKMFSPFRSTQQDFCNLAPNSYNLGPSMKWCITKVLLSASEGKTIFVVLGSLQIQLFLSVHQLVESASGTFLVGSTPPESRLFTQDNNVGITPENNTIPWRLTRTEDTRALHEQPLSKTGLRFGMKRDLAPFVKIADTEPLHCASLNCTWGSRKFWSTCKWHWFHESHVFAFITRGCFWVGLGKSAGAGASWSVSALACKNVRAASEYWFRSGRSRARVKAGENCRQTQSHILITNSRTQIVDWKFWGHKLSCQREFLLNWGKAGCWFARRRIWKFRFFDGPGSGGEPFLLTSLRVGTLRSPNKLFPAKITSLASSLEEILTQIDRCRHINNSCSVTRTVTTKPSTPIRFRSKRDIYSSPERDGQSKATCTTRTSVHRRPCQTRRCDDTLPCSASKHLLQFMDHYFNQHSADKKSGRNLNQPEIFLSSDLFCLAFLKIDLTQVFVSSPQNSWGWDLCFKIMDSNQCLDAYCSGLECISCPLLCTSEPRWQPRAHAGELFWTIASAWKVKVHEKWAKEQKRMSKLVS